MIMTNEKMINFAKRIEIPALLFLMMACSGPTATDQGNQDVAADEVAQGGDKVNTLSESERSEGWELLFDGKNLDKWRSEKGETFPSEAWVIKDGALVLEQKGGNIITREKYGDFELVWEFNLTSEANSGIKYFVDTIDNNSTGKPAFNGPEYQIIDDFNHSQIKEDPHGLSSTGSVYLLYAPENKTLNPAGEWNEARIVAKGNHVEHWLNGKKLVTYERGGQDFLERMAETKFKDYPDYGQVREGHIMLTDHGDQVYFRNIRVRRL